PADKKIDAIHTVDPEIVPFRQFDDYTEAELRRVLTGGDYFRFTFVRNPYTRIQSAYKNKILNPATEKKRASFLKKLNWNKNTLPEFGDFLDIIRTQKELKMDWHWMPQTRLALIDMIDYHLIGKQESFSQEIAPVYERLRLEVADWPNLIGTPVNQTTEERAIILN
ncbi:MAG: sulfotransferase family 2 domain-containing protein, partial [Thalassolituus sp.]